MSWLLVFLGVGAGALSTIAGLGGGILLVLLLSVILDARSALAMSAPALLAGNAHRAWLYRAHLDRRVAGALVLGAFPGALAGSVVAVSLPDAALGFVLLGVSLFAAGRELWRRRGPAAPAGALRRGAPRARTLAPAGFFAGAVAATSGAGILVSPMLLAAGLRGDAFIATASVAALSIHVARIAGYGVAGLFDARSLGAATLLGAGVLAGNVLGRALRGRLSDRAMHGLTYTVLALVVVLAFAGLA